MTKLQSIKELVKYDHCFLSPKEAEKICKPFGIKPNLRVATDTRSQLKGLTLNGINPKTKKEYQEGDITSGIDAHYLAIQICDHLKVSYQDYFGIGSQLRECCKVVKKHLTK